MSKILQKKIDHFGPSKDSGGPFFTRTSLKLAPQSPFWGLFGVHEGPGGPLELKVIFAGLLGHICSVWVPSAVYLIATGG